VEKQPPPSFFAPYAAISALNQFGIKNIFKINTNV
jgi:hypothetical protein